MKIRVYYEDTDVGGIVYHTNFIKFCERDRSEFFFKEGKVPGIEGGEFVVVKIEADFKAPARLGDMLEVKTEVLSLKGTSLVLNQKVYKDNRILFNMEIKLAFIQNGKIGKMSPEALSNLMSLFSKGLENN